MLQTGLPLSGNGNFALPHLISTTAHRSWHGVGEGHKVPSLVPSHLVLPYVILSISLNPYGHLSFLDVSSYRQISEFTGIPWWLPHVCGHVCWYTCVRVHVSPCACAYDDRGQLQESLCFLDSTHLETMSLTWSGTCRLSLAGCPLSPRDPLISVSPALRLQAHHHTWPFKTWVPRTKFRCM
jgi:hypothetical protein